MFIINYGVGIDANRNEANYRSVTDVLNDANLQIELGFSVGAVDARVNGTIVDGNEPVRGGMRIELLKKAGRKSGEPLVIANQLSPIGIGAAIVQVLNDKVSATMAPLYAELEKAEKASRVAVSLKQREVLKECKPFSDYVDSLIERLVDTSYLDAVGSLNLKPAVRAELDGVVADATEALKPKKDAITKTETACAVWTRNVTADLAMAVTIETQRVILSRVLASDPTKSWVIAATPEG